MKNRARGVVSMLLIGLMIIATAATSKAQIQVTSANPNNTTQGTVNLNVIVNGNGFKKGAIAKWLVSGTTDTGGVTVNSTTFNSSGKLTANITVAVDAYVGGFDIQVMNTDGRSGKGTELFAINSKNGQACSSTNVTSILNDSDINNLPFQIQSDGIGAYTQYSLNHGKDTVTSIVSSDCSWTLDTTSSVSRGIAVTLKYVDPSGSWTPPFTGPVTVKARMNSHCYTNPANNGVDFGSMTFYDQTLICPINVGFYYGNTWYNIAINPFNWPGTTQAQVTCGGVSNGLCSQWTVAPDPATSELNSAGQASAIGELTLPSCVGCSDGTGLGLIEFSFSFLVHK